MNETANTIYSTEACKAKLDRVVKQIFANKQILARIMKRTVPEFAEMELTDIEEHCIITDDNTISGVAVERNLTNLEGLATEDATTNEGTVYYDLLFKAAYPGAECRMIGMYINIELQQDYYPGYALETRAAYYAARRLSSQLPYLNGHTNYGSLQKVYSIWICMGNVPEKDADTITLYRMEKYDILKTVQVNRKVYDLMNFIMIRFHDDINTHDDLIRLLQVICSNKIKKAEKLAHMKSAGIRLSDDIQEGVEKMCNYGDMVEARGEIRGEARGEARGVKKTKTKIALNMFHNSEPLEKIQEYTEIPLNELQKLAEEHGFKVSSRV